MRHFKTIFQCAIAVAAIGVFSLVQAHTDTGHIVVTNAWVRVMPPSQPNTAAYMTIENKSDKELVLKSAKTDAAEQVQMHRMEHADGMMKMEQVDGISVPAQGSVELKPHGLHLMLINLKNTIPDGDTVNIELVFQDGSVVTVPVVAKSELMSEDAAAPEHMHGHE